MRADQPVSRLPLPFGITVWLVTGYKEVKAVLGDTAAFSNDFSNFGGVGLTAEQDPGGLGFRDPPAHTRLRHMLTPEFTVHRLNQLTPRIEAIVAGCLDRIAAAEQPVDLVAEFAQSVPSLVMCELLGVPYADRADFQQVRFDVAGGATTSLGAVSKSLAYLRDLVRQQRAAPTGRPAGPVDPRPRRRHRRRGTGRARRRPPGRRIRDDREHARAGGAGPAAGSGPVRTDGGRR